MTRSAALPPAPTAQHSGRSVVSRPIGQRQAHLEHLGSRAACGLSNCRPVRPAPRLLPSTSPTSYARLYARYIGPLDQPCSISDEPGRHRLMPPSRGIEHRPGRVELRHRAGLVYHRVLNGLSFLSFLVLFSFRLAPYTFGWMVVFDVADQPDTPSSTRTVVI